MPEFTRQELYDLVWSEPIKTLAARFDISDVGLAKTCHKANVPVPERGHWAKLKAGKPVFKAKLPPRGIGEPEIVRVAEKGYAQHWAYKPQALDEPEPVEPSFPDDMPEILARVQSLVGKVTVPKQLDKPHPAIAKLLEADAARARAMAASTYFWDKPIFETPFEKRRLRILNALFLSLQRAGAKPSQSNKEGRDLGVAVGSQHFSLILDRVGAPRDHRNVTSRVGQGSDIMELGIPNGSDNKSFRVVWRDQSDNPLEKQLSEIVVDLIVEGERQYRRSAVDRYKWTVERRHELREEAKRRKEALDRANEEQRIRREKERVQGLLRQAEELRKATDIRNFIGTIKSSSHGSPIDPSLLDQWIVWASAEADRIDPVKNGELIAHMNDMRREPEPITDANFKFRG